MNILLVAYYFPPIISGGSQRPARMIKHLTRLGNRVTVLAPTYEKAQPPEPNLIRIHDPSHNLNRRGVHRLQWLLRRLAVEIANSPREIFLHLFRAGSETCCAKPMRSWSAPSRRLILATYPPVETLQIGLHLAQKARLPLVADFRDGLLFEPVEAKRMGRFACLQQGIPEHRSGNGRRSGGDHHHLPLAQRVF